MKIIQQIENSIVQIQDKQVIIDSDVAILYGVETKRINEAVKNNPDKFPEGYVIIVSQSELSYLRSKFSTANESKKRYDSKAFTEKGLYMLATILKSPQATETTIAIIETFTKLRELGRAIQNVSVLNNETDKNKILQKSGNIISEIFNNDLQINETETTIELNFAVIKLKHTVKGKK